MPILVGAQEMLLLHWDGEWSASQLFRCTESCGRCKKNSACRSQVQFLTWTVLEDVEIVNCSREDLRKRFALSLSLQK